ncbi:hypothetical protein WICANDRAFT_81084 [Wickerhamomyces anomalus NRRL Y-366-8]|uniref:Flo11 domain-containing protein n=1 Tax=Wickerhamomyces anomalus (strain ATCC 58044 / CBS 1984 / NCYC 433 / NRRL Y-366-8) TaxID=683960 RepID=A0A1E3NX90_WICAA|nr:uncharacterized protein WICANDRAFT_81084 [Wickerhamomyces anomalus NRRL Y-366-8]ODQ57758.1 hypothetical protein WICANDRAFT_81084 [Wickerhamomyces anomalus NRRL Y-366-8]
MTGFIKDGEPHWNVVVPGNLGTWSSVNLKGSTDGSHYLLRGVEILLEGDSASGISEVSDYEESAAYSDSIEYDSELIFSIFAHAVAGKDYVHSVEVWVDLVDEFGLQKRDAHKYELSATIVIDASISSSTSASLSGTSTSSDTAESKSTGGISSTSKVQTTDTSSSIPTSEGDGASRTQVSNVGSVVSSVASDFPSTTIITITSCSNGVCSKVPVTTGVAVGTLTTDQIVKTFTTLCPLSPTTTEKISGGVENLRPGSSVTLKSTITALSTTVVTLTACDSGVCSKMPTTTGVSVATKTINGVESLLTTFCPLTTTVTITENHDSSPSASTVDNSFHIDADDFDNVFVSGTGLASDEFPQETTINENPNSTGSNGAPNSATVTSEIGGVSNAFNEGFTTTALQKASSTVSQETSATFGSDGTQSAASISTYEGDASKSIISLGSLLAACIILI